jgi:hypothetical protein
MDLLCFYTYLRVVYVLVNRHCKDMGSTLIGSELPIKISLGYLRHNITEVQIKRDDEAVVILDQNRSVSFLLCMCDRCIILPSLTLSS